MKTRGTRGGIVFSLEATDTAERLARVVSENPTLFEGKVFLEVAERVSWEVLEAAQQAVTGAGGSVAEVRPPSGGAPKPSRGETVVVSRTVRSGGRVESSASVIVLGDVNAGAEVVAEDDIIVLGTLRGLAHAGASGNDKAIIWAQHILSPQLRIGAALAQAGEGGLAANGPEVAQLVDGQIALRPWEH